MSYRITYGSVKKPQGKRQPSWAAILATVLALAAVIRLIVPDLSALLPGDAAVTGPALEGMMAQIAGGEDVITAFGDFCREVLHGAGAY